MIDKVTIVVGASSQIGYFLIPALLSRGGKVVAVSRQPLPEWFQQYQSETRLIWCSMDQLGQLSLPDSVELVCSGPLALAEDLAATLSPARIVAMSSASILFKRNSSDASERQLISRILQAEENLTTWAEENQADLHILQPTLVYGCGLDKNLSRVAQLIRRFRFIPVAGQARGLRQPVHAADLSALIINLLVGETAGRHTWLLAGGSCLSYADMIQSVFTVLKKPARLLRMPLWTLHLASRILPGINPQMITRQNQDLCVDDAAARLHLNWNPRPFNLVDSDLSTQRLVNP